jgi:hypothetical protein
MRLPLEFPRDRAGGLFPVDRAEAERATPWVWAGKVVLRSGKVWAAFILRLTVRCVNFWACLLDGTFVCGAAG